MTAMNKVSLEQINRLDFLKEQNTYNQAFVKIDEKLIKIVETLGKSESWLNQNIYDCLIFDVYDLATKELGATWWDGERFTEDVHVGFKLASGAKMVLSYSKPFSFEYSPIAEYSKVQQEVLNELNNKAKEPFTDIQMLSKKELITHFKNEADLEVGYEEETMTEIRRQSFIIDPSGNSVLFPPEIEKHISIKKSMMNDKE